MTKQETFNEWVKQLEPSMAVPMYPKALLLDFMKKSFFAGLEQHSHDYLVKTKSKITQAHTDGYNRGFAKAEEKIADLKANFDYVLEGKDLEIKELKDRLAEEVELHLHAEEYIKSLEKGNAQARKIILKLYNAGRDVLMCRAEEKAYDNLDNAINDRSIEQFLKEIEK